MSVLQVWYAVKLIQKPQTIVEPCADVIVSAAASRQFWSAEPRAPKNRRRRRRGVGSQIMSFQRFQKISLVLSSKFSDDLRLVMKNCNKINTQQKWHRRRRRGRRTALDNRLNLSND